MRATSTMRVGEVRRGGEQKKLNPKADPSGDLDEASNWDNFTRRPRRDPRAAGRARARRDHAYLDHLPRSRAASRGPPRARPIIRKCCCASTGTAASGPAVEAPLGDFFANCFGKRREVVSLPVIVDDGDAYNCFWRMPFRKSARIEIVNESEKPISLLYYNIDWIKKDKLPEDTPYFYAQYRQEYPVEKGKDYVLLETKGKGHYVGTVLAVRTRSPAWFGEGDEKIYIDGEAQGLDLGHGHGGLFPLRLGVEADQHALFRRALFRPVGNRRRPHQRLSLAPQRPDRLQHGHQGQLRALRLDFAGREPATTRRRAGTSARTTIPASPSGIRPASRPSPPAPRMPASARLPSLERLTVRAADFLAARHHGAGRRHRQQLDLYDGKQLLYMPKQAEARGSRFPLRYGRRSRCGCW